MCVDWFRAVGDPERARNYAASHLATASDATAQDMLVAASLFAEGADHRRAHSYCLKAVGLDPTPAGLARAAENALAAGEVDLALRWLDRALGEDPGCSEALAAKARIHLWRGEADEVHCCIRTCRHSAAVAVLRAGALALRGDWTEALASADEALALDVEHAEAMTWRGEILRHLGRRDDAMEILSRAMGGGMGRIANYSLPAHANFVLLLLEQSSGSLRPAQYAGILSSVAGLVPERSVEFADPNQHTQILSAALAAMHGNRTHAVTRMRQGQLERYHFLPYPRYRGMCAQLLLCTRTVDDVLQEFERLFQLYPDSPHLLTHRGELLLWMGRYDEAGRDFERAIAIEPATLWAYTGLCGAHMMRGEHARALACEALERRNAGPRTSRTLPAYLGETYRRLGQLDSAERHLRTAIGTAPDRVSAWLNLALVEWARGDGQAAKQRADRAFCLAPFLKRDAEDQVGGAPIDICEAALHMMRGNRSRRPITYFVHDVVRFVNLSAPAVAPSRGTYPRGH
jgi:tetratricopeptide (TPR) repeat protein